MFGRLPFSIVDVFKTVEEPVIVPPVATVDGVEVPV